MKIDTRSSDNFFAQLSLIGTECLGSPVSAQDSDLTRFLEMEKLFEIKQPL